LDVKERGGTRGIPPKKRRRAGVKRGTCHDGSSKLGGEVLKGGVKRKRHGEKTSLKKGEGMEDED